LTNPGNLGNVQLKIKMCNGVKFTNETTNNSTAQFIYQHNLHVYFQDFQTEAALLLHHKLQIAIDEDKFVARIFRINYSPVGPHPVG
jgi:aromatic ring-cleaving dioxygenase